MAVLQAKRQSPAQTSRALALQLLRRHKQLARVEIAQRSGLSETSVSRVIGELVRQRLVSEEGIARSTGGRPAVRLRLCDSYRRSIGVDIRGWETHLSVGTLSGRILETSYLRTPTDAIKTLEAIAERVLEIREQLGDHELEGIGISARGLVDSKKGIVERGSDEAWTKVPVKGHLESRLQMPVCVENNVRSAAFAEYHYGSPDVQDAQCLLFVKVDEGIGTSLILDGELFYGQHMAAGEFGQMVIADHDCATRHDRPGCLEKLASDGALCDRFRLRNGAKWVSSMADLTTCVQQICHLAMAGDTEATEALRDTAHHLGVGISNVVWGLNPDAVVVDGAIAEAWPIIGPMVEEEFADGREFLNFRNLVFRPSALRGEASIVGAAALPFQPLFANAEHAHV